MAGSYDGGGQRPQSDIQYQQAHNPYGSGDPYYNGSTSAFGSTPEKKKTGTSPWVKCGIPILILVIIGAVIGAVIGSRKSSNTTTTSSSSSGSGSPAAESSAASVKNALGRFATATDSMGVPIYPTTVR
jgi:hypothetical protein